MKAMLYADFLNLKQTLRAMAVILLVFVGVAFVSQNVSFLSMALVMSCIILPFNLFNVDTAYGWDKLALSLPISRAHAIASKYVLCAAWSGVVFALFALCTAVYCRIYPTAIFSEQLLILVVCAAATLLICAALLPLVVKFGAAKGRYILLGVVWLPIMLLIFLQKAGISNPAAGLDAALSQINPALLALGALAAAAVLYVLSALLSVAIYRKREF